MLPHIIQVTYTLMGMARTSSVYITVSVTLERYFVIVQPLVFFTCKKMLGPLVIGFSIAWNIPRFFEFTTVTMYWPHFGSNITEIHETELRKSYLYGRVYRMWLTFIIIEAIPYITIIVLNAMILRQILKSYSFRRRYLDVNRSPNVWNGGPGDNYPLFMMSKEPTEQQRELLGL